MMLIVMTAACKTAEPVQEEAPEQVKNEQQLEAPAPELTIIEKVERIPPAERTLKDDIIIVCHSPSRIDSSIQDEEARQQLLSTYISNNIYTPEAVQFFQEMATMDLSTRNAFFDQKVAALGLTGCPFLDESKARAASGATPKTLPASSSDEEALDEGDDSMVP